jgi:hypothetical protein
MKIAVLALLLAAPAFAGHPPKQPPKPVKPTPATTIDTSAYAGAQAGAVAGAVSGSSSHASGGDATATGGQGGVGGAGGTSDASSDATGGQGIGTVEGDTSRFRSTAIALSVPGATAAPAVPGQCLEHSRGWQAGMGLAARSGGTELQDQCMERQHCLAIADRYHAAGLLQAMADQLATCGGVSVRVVIPPAATPVTVVPQTGVTAEQLAIEIRRLEQRQDAIARQALAK